MWLSSKIGEAQKLLMNTDKSIGSISEELGFNDNSHFNVMFKKIYRAVADRIPSVL